MAVQGTQGNKPVDEPKASDAPKARVVDSGNRGDENDRGSQEEHANRMLGYRDDHQGAREAAIEASDRVAKESAEAIKNARPADEAGFWGDPWNQVPQEGALVETPPQPVPPPHTEGQLREMDHSPRGYREPSIAASASKFEHYDQTVHPKSRVDDPTKPL